MNNRAPFGAAARLALTPALLALACSALPGAPRGAASPPPPAASPAATAELAFWRPALVTSWQIQYSGPLDLSLDVDVYNLDLFDTEPETVAQLRADGRRVMCYFSAGSYEDWRSDAGLFPEAVRGRPLAGWPGEEWLDIRALDALRPIMAARFDLCRAKGFDGADPDNVDGYINDTGFPLTYADQLAYNRWLAQAAHQRGLAIGLKNDLGQVPDLVDHFDWALNEQCFEFDECQLLLPFIQAGKPVFNVEYNLAPAEFCPLANDLNINALYKKFELDAARQACR